jgi:uncharacterized protein
MKHSKIVALVKNQFETDTSGHDWHHIERVYKMATFLQSKEGGDIEIIQLAALLHDISDHKINGGILNNGGKVAKKLLIEQGYNAKKANFVAEIIDGVSYKGANVKDIQISIEGKIVQDADRLDAIGAIGIARAFAFGGNKNRPIYDPTIPPVLHDDFTAYANAKSHTINHFYEKLLLLKNRLHTKTAIDIGEQRHTVIEQFLNQFFEEWNLNSLQNT